MRPIEPPANEVSAATHHSSSKENPETVYVMSHIEPPTDEVLLKPIVQISLEGIRLPSQIYTGATYSVISTKTFHSYFACNVKPHMYHSTVTLETYEKSAILQIEGRFHANIV